MRVEKEVIRIMKSMFYYRHTSHHRWELYIGVGNIEVSNDINNVSGNGNEVEIELENFCASYC
jgi:hypothetical protein